jgi:phospholipase C
VGTDRRTFIKTAAAGVGFAGLQRSPVLRTALSNLGQRKPRTPVTNLVVVMMENRSLDHYLGWYGKENPNYDARQSINVPDLRPGKSGTVSSHDWGQRGLKNFHGRGYRDPNHSWDGGRAEKAGGAVNGWLHPTTKNDEFALGYYDDIDVPVWAQLVRDYQSYDRWHCSLLGPTQPNRFYLHSGQSGGRKNNDTPPQVALAEKSTQYATGWDWPTIWTLFDRYDMTAGCYASNLTELAYWGPRHAKRIRTMDSWYAQCDTGTLPQVSVLSPFFTVSEFGADDHPHADIRLGQAFLSDVTEAFVNSRHYQQGALVVTYDEWGGFHDHVDPPRIADDRGTPNDPGGKDDFAQIGFRVPSTIVSPWTHNGGTVDHTLYEHASILRFISDNWNLPYLTKRVRSTNSIGRAFRGFRQFNPEHRFTPYEAPLSVTTDSAAYAAQKFLSDETTDPTRLPEVGKIPGSPDWPLPPLLPPPSPSASAHQPTGAEGLAELRDMGWFEKFKIPTDSKLEDAFLHSRPALIKEANAPKR